MMGFLDNIDPPPAPRVYTPPTAYPNPGTYTAYAAAALRDEVDKVRSAPEGQRNHTLNVAAFNLGSLVNAGALSELTVVDELQRAAEAAGLHDHEIRTTIRSGLAGADAKVGAREIPETPERATPAATAAPVAPPTPSVFSGRLLTPTGLRNLPEPKPLIDNVLDQGTTALLYGKWASSKSFIALDWACSVATGKRWQGRPTERSRVLYVVAEGVAGFASRVNAWEAGWGTKIQDEYMRFLPMPVNLMTRDVDALTDLVASEGYGLIILDTLARCMVGGDENSAKDAGIVVDGMASIMYATPNRQGVVLGVHHTGKDGKTLRGSSAFESGVDTVYFAERDGQAVSLRRTKRKDGAERDVHILRLTTIEGTNSCVVESGENPGDSDAQSVGQLRTIFSDSFSQTGVSNTELRTIAAEHGMSQSTFYRARADLLKEGWIVNTGSGSRAYFELADQPSED